MANAKLCAVQGCGKRHHAHGYCATHNYHFIAHGNPEAGRRHASAGEGLRWLHERAQYSGDDCLMWPFEVGPHGYGVLRKKVASRIMCEIAHGPPLSPDLLAAHSCGNGHLSCINPKHLRWATRLENAADAQEHGTWNHGEKVPSSTLKEYQVIEIKAKYPKHSQRELAEMYGVTQPHISKILSGKEWAHLNVR